MRALLPRALRPPLLAAALALVAIGNLSARGPTIVRAAAKAGTLKQFISASKATEIAQAQCAEFNRSRQGTRNAPCTSMGRAVLDQTQTSRPLYVFRYILTSKEKPNGVHALMLINANTGAMVSAQQTTPAKTASDNWLSQT